MEFGNKLQAIRKDKKLSQEDLAEKLNISRQAVAKWEAGQAYPDIDNLIKLSELFKITIDSMIKNTSACSKDILNSVEIDFKEIIEFLCTAKKNTYASKSKKETVSSRMNSHDLSFESGKFTYLDTYLGGERFSGEEAVWVEEKPVWSMNYSGRVLEETFSGEFLQEVLSLVPEEYPFRGPILHRNGDYTYHCSVKGDFTWFQGNEEIFYNNRKVYECYFHGGIVN